MHTSLRPGYKADGMVTKFSFITSSSKSSIGYSFRCSKRKKRKEKKRSKEKAKVGTHFVKSQQHNKELYSTDHAIKSIKFSQELKF